MKIKSGQKVQIWSTVHSGALPCDIWAICSCLLDPTFAYVAQHQTSTPQTHWCTTPPGLKNIFECRDVLDIMTHSRVSWPKTSLAQLLNKTYLGILITIHLGGLFNQWGTRGFKLPPTIHNIQTFVLKLVIYPLLYATFLYTRKLPVRTTWRRKVAEKLAHNSVLNFGMTIVMRRHLVRWGHRSRKSWNLGLFWRVVH